MKLEVGMYVRINDFISRIEHLNTSKKGNTYMQFKQPNGLLASHNIIDLIEVGDYVNGYPVIEISTHQILGKIICTENDSCQNRCVDEKRIKSIVTKEQFKQMEYKVVE